MHSFSSIKDFNQCPRLYQEKRVLKTVKFVPTAATRHGVEMHKAFEDYVNDGTPLPDKFARHEPLIAELKSYDGHKLCEFAMALDGQGNATDYYDTAIPNPKAWDTNPAAFIGGIADLIIVNENNPRAMYFDYKSGKGNYPDIEQCELMALMLMQLLPHIDEVVTGLLFVEAGKLIDKTYARTEIPAIWEKWVANIARIEQAKATNVWQTKPNQLCSWCQVTHCPEWRERKWTMQ